MTEREWIYLLIGFVICFLGCAYVISEIIETSKIEKELDEIKKYAEALMKEDTE